MTGRENENAQPLQTETDDEHEIDESVLNAEDIEAADEEQAVHLCLDVKNDPDYARKIVEAIVYIEGAIAITKLVAWTKLDKTSLRDIVEEINTRYVSIDSGLEIREIGASFHMISSPMIFNALAQIRGAKRKTRLSKAVLETLSIIAYKQPITKAEIDDIRQADSARHIKALLKEELIRAAGRKNVLYNPQTYGTTNKFLLHFDLDSLEDLPTLREIKDLEFGKDE